MKFTLLVLCLNEIDCLKAILPRIDKTCTDQILLVDGGSTDGSIEYAENQGLDILRQKGKGIIAGIKEGIEAAEGDVIILFTPDGNMIPKKLPELVTKMKEGYDMVCVSRYAKGQKVKTIL